MNGLLATVEIWSGQPIRIDEPAKEKDMAKFEYRSAQSWRGIPLVHVALGGGEGGRYRAAQARGVVAIGDTAVGVVAVGVVAVGVVALGPVALAVVALGVAGVGVVSVGVAAVGVVAAGVVAVGLHAAGVVVMTLHG